MYHSGDLIIYGNNGVCRVEKISKPNLPGTDRDAEYYTLKPLFQDSTIYTPVKNKVFMRPVITRKEAEQLIDSIPQMQTESFYSQSTQQLSEHYQTFLQSHDCADLVQLAMSIYSKKQHVLQCRHKFGQVDERYMKKAEELLYGELSVALDMPRDQVASYIASRIGPASDQSAN